MFASGINKNVKKFAPKVPGRRKPGGCPAPIPTPAPVLGPASIAVGATPTPSLKSIQLPSDFEHGATPKVRSTAAPIPIPSASPQPVRASTTPAPTPNPIPIPILASTMEVSCEPTASPAASTLISTLITNTTGIPSIEVVDTGEEQEPQHEERPQTKPLSTPVVKSTIPRYTATHTLTPTSALVPIPVPFSTEKHEVPPRLTRPPRIQLTSNIPTPIRDTTEDDNGNDALAETTSKRRRISKSMQTVTTGERSEPRVLNGIASTPDASNNITTILDEEAEEPPQPGESSSSTAPKPIPTRKPRTTPKDTKAPKAPTTRKPKTSSITPPKKRAPRKPRAATSPADADNPENPTDPSTSPPPRRRKRARSATPPDAENIPIVPSVIKMADLCRDIKTGRKSKRFEELEKLDWTEVVRKQRAKKARLEAAQAAGEDVPPPESTEQRLERIANENTRAAPNPPRHAMQVRVVDGQIVLDEETLTIDRRDHVTETVTQEVVEESSLTRRINAGTWSKREKPERWDEESTNKFYEGLSMFGTDFELISRLFPERSRRQMKNKFNAEERRDPGRVTRALRTRIAVDIEAYSTATNTVFGAPEELERELEEMREAHAQEERAAGEAARELERERRTMADAELAAEKERGGRSGHGTGGAGGKKRGKKGGGGGQFISRHAGGGEEMILGSI